MCVCVVLCCSIAIEINLQTFVGRLANVSAISANQVATWPPAVASVRTQRSTSLVIAQLQTIDIKIGDTGTHAHTRPHQSSQAHLGRVQQKKINEFVFKA